MVLLGVNIDHVATVRAARYRRGDATQDTRFGEPDPARAVHEAELGGADIITVHLREDRRHITDRDLELVLGLARVRVNLEMAASPEMVGIATNGMARAPGERTGPGAAGGTIRAHMCTLVPEGRQEVTTEGGLHVSADAPRLTACVSQLRDAGLVVSAFIDPDLRQVEAAKAAGFDACELHTGAYAAAFARAGGDVSAEPVKAQVARLTDAGRRAASLGLRLNAGHALNYANVGVVAALPRMSELHIGHAIVSRAVFTGLRAAVREMKEAIALSVR